MVAIVDCFGKKFVILHSKAEDYEGEFFEDWRK
jgi:hypothetical protein